MKKGFLILGIIFIAITAGIFVYLTFFKAGIPIVDVRISGDVTISGDSTQPPAGDLPRIQDTNTQLYGITVEAEVESSTTTEQVIPLTRFTQLTSEPVVGMTFTGTSTARYLTRGSALIKDISLISGAVTSSVDTNITDIIDASFNSDGNMLLITFINDTERHYFIGTVQTNTKGKKTFKGSLLPENTIDAAFSGQNNIIRYTLSTQNGSEIHTFTPESRTDTTSATLPYSNALLAASFFTDTYYTYPTPTAGLMGSTHNPQNNEYIASGGRGLTVYNFGEGIAITKHNTDKDVVTRVVINNQEYGIPITLKTDACTPNITSKETLICGTSFSWDSNMKYPDDWYKGTYRFEDSIMEVDFVSGSAFVIGNPLRETGVSFDTLKMLTHQTIPDTYLLINKNNGYLWMFRDI